MKITLKSIVAIAQSVLVLVAIFVMFAPAVVHTTDLGILGKYTFEMNGFQAWLGANIESNEYFTIALNPSFGGVFTLILMILLVLCPIAKMFLKDAKIVKIFNIAICGVAVVAAIFLFCGGTGLMINADGKEVKGFSLAAGAIVPAILLIVVGGASVVDQFVLKD